MSLNKDLIVESFLELYKTYRREKPHRMYLSIGDNSGFSNDNIANAIKNIADGEISYGDILVLFDSSKKNNGHDGVLITDDKLYYKEGLEETIIHFKDIKDCEYLKKFFGDKIKFNLNSGFEYILHPFVPKEYRSMLVEAFNKISASYEVAPDEDEIEE